MNWRAIRWSFGFALLAFVLGWVVKPTPPPKVSTNLWLDSEGGFAYVYTPGSNKSMEIAWLKDSEFEGCSVHQMGVNLTVDQGTVVEPAGTLPGAQFDLSGAVVTFGDFGASTSPLTVQRGARPTPPGAPDHPGNDSSWK